MQFGLFQAVEIERITHLSAESAASSACAVASMASSSSRRGLAGFEVPAWTKKEHEDQGEKRLETLCYQNNELLVIKI